MTLDISQIDFAQLDFKKGDGLIPAVVQDADTLQVLTLAYMDEAALREPPSPPRGEGNRKWSYPHLHALRVQVTLEIGTRDRARVKHAGGQGA